jgi:hypothetical protein
VTIDPNAVDQVRHYQSAIATFNTGGPFNRNGKGSGARFWGATTISLPIIWLAGEPAHIHATPLRAINGTGADAWRSRMTAIERALSRAITTINDNEILKQLALLCAAGLFVSVLMLTYGIDLSPGFF